MSSRRLTSISALTVSPGNRVPSLLSTDTTTGYVTTLLVLVAASRTCATVPRNCRSAKASAVNDTPCPA